MAGNWQKIDGAAIRLAFLGCGNITRKHAKTIGDLKEKTALYFASRSAEKSEQYRRELKGAGGFDSYEAALSSAEIDAVMINTPPDSHLALTLAALQAGKHVIVEKPPFFKSTDFDTVRAAAKDASRQVMVAENYYYKPMLVKLREVLQSGVIGDILFMNFNALKEQKSSGDWRDDVQIAGGGALFEGGIHWINFMANCGLTIKTIAGFQPAQRTEAERSILAVAEYEEGAVATLFYSWEVPTVLQGLRISRIFGREGSISFESNGVFLFVRGRRKSLGFPGLATITGTRPMFEDFLRALRSGDDPQFTLDLAQRDLQLIEKIYSDIRARG